MVKEFIGNRGFYSENDKNKKSDADNVTNVTNIIDRFIFMNYSLSFFDIIIKKYNEYYVSIENAYEISENNNKIIIDYDSLIKSIETSIDTTYKNHVDELLRISNIYLGFDYLGEPSSKIKDFLYIYLGIAENRRLIIDVTEKLVPGNYNTTIFNLFNNTINEIGDFDNKIKKYAQNLYKIFLHKFYNFACFLSDKFALYVVKIKNHEKIYSKILNGFEGKIVIKYLKDKKDPDIAEKINYVLSLLLDNNLKVVISEDLLKLTKENKDFISLINTFYQNITELNINKPVGIGDFELEQFVLMNIFNILYQSAKNRYAIEIKSMFKSSEKHRYPILTQSLYKEYLLSSSINSITGFGNSVFVDIFFNREEFKQDKIIYLVDRDYERVLKHLVSLLKNNYKNINEDALIKRIKEILEDKMEFREVYPRVFSKSVKKEFGIDSDNKISGEIIRSLKFYRFKLDYIIDNYDTNNELYKNILKKVGEGEEKKESHRDEAEKLIKDIQSTNNEEYEED
ncbi:MAG: hypothetical protein QXV63_02375 [Candidatus Aenigmatarchaeota archaeon]